MKTKIIISTLWLIFAVLFFTLAWLHWAESKQIIQEFKITRVFGDGAEFTVGSISIEKPFQDFANEFNNKYLADQNESNRKANRLAACGYFLAGLTALVSMGLTSWEYILVLWAKFVLLVKSRKTSKNSK